MEVRLCVGQQLITFALARCRTRANRIGFPTLWDSFYSFGRIWKRSRFIKSRRGRLAFLLISKIYRQMYADTGIATDSNGSRVPGVGCVYWRSRAAICSLELLCRSCRCRRNSEDYRMEFRQLHGELDAIRYYLHVALWECQKPVKRLSSWFFLKMVFNPQGQRSP
jgi:hypothetical protein